VRNCECLQSRYFILSSLILSKSYLGNFRSSAALSASVRAVTASYGSRCVSTDRLNDVFAHTAPQGTSFESMTPSVIWLDFFVRYTERTDPGR
jgi:hypothetical protein